MPTPVSSPSLARKALFSCVLALVCLVVVEAAGWIALRLETGRWPSPDRRRDERTGVAAEAAGVGDPLPATPRRGRRFPAVYRGEVLHPYLGFVQDPAAAADPWLRVNPQGFFTVPAEPPPPERRFTVAVFGGSVAQHLSIAGRRVLIRALRRTPGPAGKRIWIESYALGGYKQPQQLAALAYLLARGEPPDLAITLDGFNDIVLPVVENLRDGVHPVYPRGWSYRVSGLPDAEAQLLVGEIAHLQNRRRRRAERAGRSPWRWSAAAHLVWRSLDRADAGRVARLREDLASRAEVERPFLAGGPAFQPPGNAEALYRDLAALWRRSSEAMYALCRSRGIPYYHFLQPNQYLPGTKPMGRAEEKAAIDPGHPYRPAVEAGYPHLQEAGRELVAAGVSFHDLTEIFAGVSEQLYIDTCCHLNRRGNQLLAAEMAEIITGSP